MKDNQVQMSETIKIGILLAISGGFMDAYSYMGRGEVFANAQTGNMLLFGIHAAAGDWTQALSYASPVLAFAFGIALTAMIRYKRKDKNLLHWREITVMLEAIILFGVGFIPETRNLLANTLTSFACGMQVESFRKIRGNGMATTMCIGNLRSGTQNICDYLQTGKIKSLKKGILYYGIIFFFICGAILGNYAVNVMGTRAIHISVGILSVAFSIMFLDGIRVNPKESYINS